MLKHRFTRSQLVPCPENIFNYEKTIMTARVKKKLLFVRLLDTESQGYTIDVFVKQDAKLIDVLVKKVMFYAIQSVTVQQIVKKIIMYNLS